MLFICDDIRVHTYIHIYTYAHIDLYICMYIHTYTLLKLYLKSLLKLRQCFTHHGTARLGRDIECRCDTVRSILILSRSLFATDPANLVFDCCARLFSAEQRLHERSFQFSLSQRI